MAKRDRVGDVCFSRNFVQAKCLAGLVYELLDDYRRALVAVSSEGGVDPVVVASLRIMFQFLRTQAAVLARRPLLLLQQVPTRGMRITVCSMDGSLRSKIWTVVVHRTLPCPALCGTFPRR